VIKLGTRVRIAEIHPQDGWFLRRALLEGKSGVARTNLRPTAERPWLLGDIALDEPLTVNGVHVDRIRLVTRSVEVR
jgi:hypothetical protein